MTKLFSKVAAPFYTPTAAAAAAKSLQSCPTLCDPIDGSPPGSPIPGILQARTLERVAISFCNAWQWKVKVKLLSRVHLLTTPWTSVHQAPPSMGFSRQEYTPTGHALSFQFHHILINTCYCRFDCSHPRMRSAVSSLCFAFHGDWW